MSLVQKTYFVKKIGTIGQSVWSVHRETTDKQTNRGDQYTLRKSEISQSNESRSESGYFAKPLSFNCMINLYCDKSRSNVKGQRPKVKGIVNLVVIIQINSVQYSDILFS